uniref:Opsin 8, group member a n=1 Tax=Erpetoichthys calabaricus TaxID=27687 RepID=A0A8C4RVL0_ERPCA
MECPNACRGSHMSQGKAFILFVLFSAILSVIGNGAVLTVAILKSSRLKPAELLSVNLAVTDLGMALTMYPLAIASAWSHAWLGGDSSCIYYSVAGFLFGVASITTLAVMAVVRLNLTSTSSVTSKKILHAIACIWLYALFWALLPLCGWGKYGPEPFGISCSILWATAHESRNQSSFIVVIFMLCIILPTFTLVHCYSLIAWKHHKAYKAMKNREQIPNAGKLDRQLTLVGAYFLFPCHCKFMFIMAVLVTAGFLICWTPYTVVSFWSMFYSSANIPPEMSLLPCLFAKSSTVYNPFIYYKFSKTFRKEVRDLKRYCLCCLKVTDSGNPSREEPTVHRMEKNIVDIRPVSIDNNKSNQETEGALELSPNRVELACSVSVVPIPTRAAAPSWSGGAVIPLPVLPGVRSPHRDLLYD